MPAERDLDVGEIEQCSTMTSHVLGMLREAACVALHRFHGPECIAAAAIERKGADAETWNVRWTEPTPAMLASHKQRIAENGACAVAIVTAYRALGYKVVAEAEHTTGSDYVMVRDGGDPDDLVRLEVSGIVSAKESAADRLRDKRSELINGRDRRPGYATVVVFPVNPVRILIDYVPEEA